jgi:hypothetical protein
MENFRIKQAENLLKSAAKNKTKTKELKNAKPGFINVDIYESVINNLFEAEEFIYSSRPIHKLDSDDANNFVSKILAARKDIDIILSDFGVIDKIAPEEDVKENFKDYLILTTKNNFKKTIGKFGIDTQKIVVAGVPLVPEDMQILNPKMPESALGPISKKIQHVKNDIERKMDQFQLKNMVVLVEADKSGELLSKRAKEMYNAKIVVVENLKDITVEEFISIMP